MRADITLIGPDGRRIDVALRTPSGATVGDVVRRIRETIGVPVAGLWVDGRPLPEAAPIAEHVPTGAEVALGPMPPPRQGIGRLVVAAGPGAGTTYPIPRGCTDIGRAAECDVVVPDPAVSRRHVAVIWDGRGMRVRDLTSSNGVSVDGVVVNAEVTVTPDVRIRIGNTVLRVDDGVRRSPSPPEPDAVIDWPTRPTHTAATMWRWGAALVPLLAAVAVSALVHDVRLLAFALLSPLSLLGATVGERLHQSRSVRRRTSGWRTAFARAESQLSAALTGERIRRHAELPDPFDALADLRDCQRTWSTSVVRIGLGTAAARTILSEGHARRSAGDVSLVPIGVDLADGPLALDAPRHISLPLARWIVAQWVISQGGSGRIDVIADADRGADWRWLQWMAAARIAGVAENRSSADDPNRLVVVDVADASSAAVPMSGPLVVVGTLPNAVATVTACVATCGEVTVRTAAATITRVVPDLVTDTWAQRAARRHAAAEVGSSSVDPPDRSALLDVLGLHTPTGDAVVSRWRRADYGAAVAIGVGASGSPFVADLVRDGPHALVAGTTGSGKSELLQSWVLALAATYPPDALAFVLIDYKGGATFGAIVELPHVIGVVTDLDSAATRRALQSFDAELRRRESALARARATHLLAYRATNAEPRLARCVIVIDEYAALAAELPEFLAGLLAVAQRGRSLGVHLVLATQRPAGVVSADIRANTSLRIALRVADPVDSTDVVDVDDAAFLPVQVPGRAVVRTPAETRLVQIASAGIPSDEPAEVEVLPLDTDGVPNPEAERPPADELVAAICAAARGHNYGAAAPIWQSELPAWLPVRDLPNSAGAWSVALGLVDRPQLQRHETLAVDLGRGTTVGIAGPPRSGRSTALISLALTAADQLPATDLVIHSVAAAGGGLGVLRPLRHVGTDVSDADLECVARFVRRLSADVRDRRTRLAKLELASADDARSAGVGLRAALVLIDGWERLVAQLDAADGGVAAARLVEVLRTGPAVGVSVAITFDAAPPWLSRLMSVLCHRIALGSSLGSEGSVGSVGGVARPPPRASPRPGRGVLLDDGAEVQLAVATDAAEPSAYRQRAAEIAERDGGQARHRLATSAAVRPLPVEVPFSTLPRTLDRFVLGVGGDTGQVVELDLLGERTRLLVAGPPASGRTALLGLIAAQAMAMRVRVVLVGDTPLASSALALRGNRVAANELELHRLDDPRPIALDSPTVLLVDDADTIADCAAADSVVDAIRASAAGVVVVVAGDSARLAASFRGPAAEIRRSRTGLLLVPRPADGELLGVRLEPPMPTALPGRGYLVRRGSDGPVPIQLARRDGTCASGELPTSTLPRDWPVDLAISD